MAENDVITDEIKELPEVDPTEILKSVSLNLDGDAEPEPEVAVAKPIAAKVEKNGADDEKVAKELDIVVIDPTSIAFKYVEAMVEAGIKQSKRALYAHPSEKEYKV